MSTYLALTFGTLLSSQGTDTSFELPSQYLRALRSFCIQLIRSALRRFSLAFPSAFRRFRLYQVFPAVLLASRLSGDFAEFIRFENRFDVSNSSRTALCEANPTAIR
ncbi:hypothetical protein P3T37_003712 [Kitasatospora sp. MAA4]|nr:hypothetical protein [Kitasatospora sp. MAA4]